MNARYLVATLFILVSIGMALTSRSTLTPKRGVDHVFYGAAPFHFIGQEIAIGNLDGDNYDDVIAGILWDDPAPGGVVLKFQSVCAGDWTAFLAESVHVDTTQETQRVVCGFTGNFGIEHWAYWQSLGWVFVESLLTCDTCYSYEIDTENQGAIVVVKGGDWAGKGHDIDLGVSLPDLMVLGRQPGDNIFNGMAAGNVNLTSEPGPDHFDDLVVGAPQDGGPVYGSGEVYVVHGNANLFSAFPDTISLADSTDFASLAHVFQGRDTYDRFGLGVAVGALNDHDNEDIIVAAPNAAGSDNGKPRSGEIYIFYANDSLRSQPQIIDLSMLDTDSTKADSYVSFIYGDAAGSHVGVTNVRHEAGGGYEPVGLAIGDWNGDGFNDLAIGAGHAPPDSAGKVWIIFGRDSLDLLNKLKPGKRIYLANAPGGANAADVVFEGIAGSKLGAGVAFVDADTSEVPVRDDLIIGAPLAGTGPKLKRGEVYIVFGDTEANLISPRTRDVSNASHVDVVIYGEDANDQLGGHFAGDFDLDNDGKNDLGISGHQENFVFFGQPRADWEAIIDLKTVLQTNPETKIIKYVDQPPTNSTTIRFADLDNDDTMDLVFGGYDNEGLGGQFHAGRMYVAKGQDTWQSGSISTATWSGNVFVNGDIVVASGATLTIQAGTDVWIWPSDVEKNGLGADTMKVEFKVTGTLDVQGTKMNRVRFLVWNADTALSVADSLWTGIVVDSAATVSSFSYCKIRNAEIALTHYSTTTATYENVTVQSSFRGVKVAGGSVTFNDLTIEGAEIGIEHTGGSLALDGLTIFDCATLGINSDAPVVLTDSDIIYDMGGIESTDSLTMTNSRVTWGGGLLGFLGVRCLGVADIRHCTISARGIGVLVEDGYLLSDTISSEGNAMSVAGEVTCSQSILTGTGADPNYGISVGSSTSDLTLRQTTVASFDVGVYFGASSSGDIDSSCTFINNDIGVEVFSTSNPTIRNSTFDYDTTNGIYCHTGASITIEGNTITNSAIGIYCLNSSGPTIQGENVITDNSGGIKCDDYSHATIRSNKIADNTGGIVTLNGADPDVGSSCNPTTCQPGCSTNGGNKITGSSGYHISNLSASVTIRAECNYWGTRPPKPLKFYGSVDYTPYLTTDPLPGLVARREDGGDGEEVDDPPALPTTYALSEGYPNPFNPVITIPYQLPPPGGEVSITIYDVGGRLIRTLVNDTKRPGFYSARWQGINNRGESVASGVYFAKMDSGHFTHVRKIVLLK